MEKLRSLLKCIIFCGRQNIALRGHRNEAALEWDPTSGEEPDSNPGNFLSLVHFRAEAGDTALTHSLATGTDGSGTRKITYTTPGYKMSFWMSLLSICREGSRRTYKK